MYTYLSPLGMYANNANCSIPLRVSAKRRNGAFHIHTDFKQQFNKANVLHTNWDAVSHLMNRYVGLSLCSEKGLSAH